MNKRRTGSILIVSGLLLIAAALCLCVYNLVDEARASDSVTTVLEQLQPEPAPTAEEPQTPEESDALPTAPEQPAYVLNPEMQMPVQFVEGWDYVGILEIPALGLQLPVISRWSYPALKVAPCRYYGSPYTDDLVLAAHNYASHFGTLNALTQGDAVIFTDMDGNVFEYAVAVIETLMPEDVAEMKSGQWDLTLFTCTVGGQYRVTVRCDKAA